MLTDAEHDDAAFLVVGDPFGYGRSLYAYGMHLCVPQVHLA